MTEAETGRVGGLVLFKHDKTVGGESMEQTAVNEVKDKRRALRKVCRFLPVDYVVDNRLFRGLIMDISETGARIENTMPFLPGVRATMTFMELYSLGPVKTKATVVRALENGFAVHFDSLSAHQGETISNFVSKE